MNELPELYNVLKGDMSFVGPRPLLVQYLPLYNATQRHRHDVRLGITGLAQVNRRNSISWEEKFEWDVRYTQSISLLMDTKIFFRTIAVVLSRQGITSKISATMEAFQGSKEEKK